MRVAFLNWRDTSNPEGGGSEVYIEEIGRRLVARGHDVTLVCAAFPGAPELDIRHGVRIIRRGSKLSVYREARRLLRSGALGNVDVVVDTQNGIPFLAPWASSSPVVVLVHHVHREQWPVVYDPIRSRVGWWVESRLAPRVYRGRPYVAVSAATARELAELGVERERIEIVHNGTSGPQRLERHPSDPTPRILVLGRLVPHKRVEHVLSAAGALRSRFPDLRVAVVGEGWWRPELEASARELGVADMVEFTGHVTEERKYEQIGRAWVLALPSLKEGWGLVVMEAASMGVPTVAYRSAGGVTESILDDETGLLVNDSVADLTRALHAVLSEEPLRQRLSQAAQTHAQEFSWDTSAMRFERVLLAAQDESRREPSSSTRRRRRVRRQSGERPSAMR